MPVVPAGTEIRMCMASRRLLLRTAGTFSQVRQSYLPALRGPLLRPMLSRGAEGAAETIELLDEYAEITVDIASRRG